MPRFLFQRVFDRVRWGMGTQMSRPLKAQVATLSARSTILPRVTLSRARMRLLTRSSDLVLVVFFAIGSVSFTYSNNSPLSVVFFDFFFFFEVSFTTSFSSGLAEAA